MKSTACSDVGRVDKYVDVDHRTQGRLRIDEVCECGALEQNDCYVGGCESLQQFIDALSTRDCETAMAARERDKRAPHVIGDERVIGNRTDDSLEQRGDAGLVLGFARQFL